MQGKYLHKSVLHQLYQSNGLGTRNIYPEETGITFIQNYKGLMTMLLIQAGTKKYLRLIWLLFLSSHSQSTRCLDQI